MYSKKALLITRKNSLAEIAPPIVAYLTFFQGSFRLCSYGDGAGNSHLNTHCPLAAHSISSVGKTPLSYLI
jgi:hypothetical protein